MITRYQHDQKACGGTDKQCYWCLLEVVKILGNAVKHQHEMTLALGNAVKLMADAYVPHPHCTCREIQVTDERRHFQGCPVRGYDVCGARTIGGRTCSRPVQHEGDCA